MTKITESDIELLAIRKLEDLGYHYLYGPDIASNGAHPERDNYEQVLILQRLKHSVKRINPDIPGSSNTNFNSRKTVKRNNEIIKA